MRSRLPAKPTWPSARWKASPTSTTSTPHPRRMPRPPARPSTGSSRRRCWPRSWPRASCRRWRSASVRTRWWCDRAFEIGQYGGILRGAGPEGFAGHLIEESQQPMAKWPPDASIFYPNIPKSWELSADEKVFTLHLRRGMKWSDGEDLDAEDFEFFFESILKSEEITGVIPEPRERYRVGGELMTMRTIDRYTVQYTFAVPYFNAVRSGWARGRAFAPAHYLSQYHIEHNPDAASLAKSEGYETWIEAFAAHHSDRGHSGSLPVGYSFTDLPVTDIFYLKEDGPGVQFWERNPYYWKVDTAGNQLPYADGIQRLKAPEPTANRPRQADGRRARLARFWSHGHWRSSRLPAERGIRGVSGLFVARPIQVHANRRGLQLHPQRSGQAADVQRPAVSHGVIIRDKPPGDQRQALQRSGGAVHPRRPQPLDGLRRLDDHPQRRVRRGSGQPPAG